MEYTEDTDGKVKREATKPTIVSQMRDLKCEMRDSKPETAAIKSTKDFTG